MTADERKEPRRFCREGERRVDDGLLSPVSCSTNYTAAGAVARTSLLVPHSILVAFFRRCTFTDAEDHRLRVCGSDFGQQVPARSPFMNFPAVGEANWEG